jgi:hypothetical protein
MVSKEYKTFHISAWARPECGEILVLPVSFATGLALLSHP